MNTKNNKRRQASQEKIEKVFLELLQSREISEITVSDICKRTELNRSTFYANYIDIYDLADKIRDKLEKEVQMLYENNNIENSGYLKLFRHIKENQIFYNTYFKLGYDNKQFDPKFLNIETLPFPENNIKYHVEFHKAGLNAVIKMWLANKCEESPEAMVKIIEDEYTNRRSATPNTKK